MATIEKIIDQNDYKARAGDLKPMDAYEETIRKNAVLYNVILFTPGTSSRLAQSFTDLERAVAYAKIVLQEPNRIRAAMIYAIDEHDHHALHGTIRRDLVYKRVVPQRY